MNLNKMRHVLEVESCRSFSIAAERLLLTQSAVTKSISAVEQELGFDIFIRTSRGVELSDEGRAFIDRLRRVMTDIYDLLDDASAKQKKRSERLRVGVCPSSLEAAMVEPLFSWAKEQYPVILEVSEGRIENLVRYLRRGDLDMVFGSTIALKSWKELTLKHIPNLKTEIYVRKDHPLTSKPLVTLKDLSQYDFVSPTNIEPVSSIIRKIYENTDQSASRRTHVINYFPSASRFILATDCFSFVAENYTKKQNFINKFSILPIEYDFPEFLLSFAHYSHHPLKKVAKTFIQHFLQ
tara:strand:- start:2593 stop:3477 length:885 start_codon:yes stop_codon:yes gene_type:complete